MICVVRPKTENPSAVTDSLFEVILQLAGAFVLSSPFSHDVQVTIRLINYSMLIKCGNQFSAWPAVATAEYEGEDESMARMMKYRRRW